MKKNDIREPVFLSVPEAARLCGISRNTMYLWVRDKKLDAFQTPGRTYMIRPADLVRFMQNSGMFIPADLYDLMRRDEAEAATRRNAHGAVQRPALLVVDDDPAIHKVLNRLLGDHYVLYQAMTGFEALHVLTVRQDVQLVVLDYRMPGINGAETIRQMKRLCPDMRVILLSGYLNDVPADIRHDPCVADALEKPADAERLTQAIAQAIPTASASG